MYNMNKDKKKIFEHYFREWLKLIQKPEIMTSSNTSDYLDNEPYKAIVQLGIPILPLIMEKIRQGFFLFNEAASRIMNLKLMDISPKGIVPISEQEVSRLWLNWWQVNRDKIKPKLITPRPLKTKSIKQIQRILLIDDSKTVTEMLTEYLTMLGYDCTTANNGREGIKLLKQKPYDVVFLDLAMPKFSGLDVLESLKKKELMKKQKIILLTALTIADEEVSELRKTGVHSFLRKPFDVDMIVEKIEQITTENEAVRNYEK